MLVDAYYLSLPVGHGTVLALSLSSLPLLSPSAAVVGRWTGRCCALVASPLIPNSNTRTVARGAEPSVNFLSSAVPSFHAPSYDSDLDAQTPVMHPHAA